MWTTMWMLVSVWMWHWRNVNNVADHTIGVSNEWCDDHTTVGLWEWQFTYLTLARRPTWTRWPCWSRHAISAIFSWKSRKLTTWTSVGCTQPDGVKGTQQQQQQEGSGHVESFRNSELAGVLLFSLSPHVLFISFSFTWQQWNGIIANKFILYV